MSEEVDFDSLDYVLHYFKKCKPEEQFLLRHIFEQIGKEQYFNAFRSIGELTKLCAGNLQEVINRS